MKSLLDFLLPLRRLKALEQRVARLEADLQAQADLRDQAHDLLQKRQPREQAHEWALRVLVSGNYQDEHFPQGLRVIGRDYNTPKA